MLILILIKLWR